MDGQKDAQTDKYMLLFRGMDWHKGLSPEEMQEIVSRWRNWFEGLLADGRALAGNPLERECKVVSGKNGTVADGPYAESKEALGGYFMLQVSGMDEAVEIARNCPGLPYGAVIEVRPVASECKLKEHAERARQEEGSLATVPA